MEVVFSVLNKANFKQNIRILQYHNKTDKEQQNKSKYYKLRFINLLNILASA